MKSKRRKGDQGKMAYEIKLTVLIKTLGEKYTKEEFYEIFNKALWSIEEFRDIEIYEFEVDPEYIEKHFSDIREQVIDVTRET